MKSILSMITGTLCVCSFALTAEDKIGTTSAPVVASAPAPVVVTPSGSDLITAPVSVSTTTPVVATTPATIATSGPVAVSPASVSPAAVEASADKAVSVKADDGKQTSFFDQFKVSEQAPRTCQAALDEMIKNGTVTIDLSYTTDFAENGDATFSACYNKLKETNSFGTNSSNLYINLSKTNVTPEFIAKWSAEFKKDKKTVLWNLSDNPNLSDSVIDSIADLSNVCSLNLANTGVTDTGIAKLSSLIETGGLKTISLITLSGTKATDQAVSTLRDAFKKALDTWQTANAGKTYPLEGEGGVTFNKPFVPQDFKIETKVPGQAEPATVAPVTATPVTSSVDAAQVSNKQIADVLSDADKILASAGSTTTAAPAITAPAA